MGKNRDEFDLILAKIIGSLPDYVQEQLKELPVIVEDEPSESIRQEMGELELDEPSELCGLHSGIPLTEKSITSPSPTHSVIFLFRGPISRLAGKDACELKKQIRITLLHEIAHHFGFSEEELEAIGYG